MFCPNCGRELSDLADICVGCGRSVRSVTKNAGNDSASVGWWWLGFFFPLIGLILWIVWTGNFPIKARRAGFGALTGAIVSVALTVLIYVAYIALIVGILSMSSGSYMF